MKKLNLLTRTLLLFALVAGSTSMWAKHVPYLTLTFPDDNFSNNGLTTKQYESTWTAKSGDYVWSISNFNNNNWGSDWKYIKCGRKKGKSANTPSIATITTSSPIDKLVMEVVVSLSAIDNSDYNSIKMYVASDEDFESNLQTVNATIPTGGGDLVFSVPSPATGQYYKLEFNTKGSTSNNGHTVITQVAYCASPEADGPELAAINTTPIVWDFTTMSETVSTETLNNWTATDATSLISYKAGSSDKFKNSTFQPNGKSTMTGASAARFFILSIAASGVLTIKSNSAKTGEYIIYQGATDDITAATYKKSIYTNSDNLTRSASIEVTDGGYVFIGFGAQIYTDQIQWAVADGISFTTTANMDGWRSFYDATQDYEVDANTSIYVAAKSANSGEVELTKKDGITKIPHGEAVILKTTAGDHKMTLTKTTGAATLGANVLAYAASAPVDGYRLGYKSGTGVAFYKYTATAPASGVVYIDKANVNTGAGAHEFLALSFGDTTGINAVEAKKAENGVYYNLAGQQVAQPTKGLYIVNGKKVIIK